MPILEVARSQAWESGSLLAGIVRSNPAGGKDVGLFKVLRDVQVVVSSSVWWPVQRSHNESGASEYDRKASTMKRPCPARGCCTMGKKMFWYWLISTECSYIVDIRGPIGASHEFGRRAYGFTRKTLQLGMTIIFKLCHCTMLQFVTYSYT